MHTLRLGLCRATFLAAFALLILPTVAQAATRHVTSSGDSGKPGQLRYVIAHANPGDTVLIDAGVNPSLARGEITITKNLTIEGQSARSTTINAHRTSRIFVIGSPSVTSGPTVSIRKLTLTGGKTTDTSGTDVTWGGALIAFGATVDLTDVMLTRNEAFSNSASDSADGGALAASGLTTFSLDRVTVAGNSAVVTAGGGGAEGGGVFAAATTTIINSTIADNKAQATGSGGSADGGGIAISAEQLNLFSTTLANNAAVAPPGNSSGGNLSGSIFGSVDLKNTIIAGGMAASESNCAAGGYTDEGHNLESTTPSQCGLSNASPSFDLIGVDPQFTTTEPANNGGQTNTLALGSASPAIDYVPLAQCTDESGKPLTVDQRRKKRPDSAETACDIGAYESGAK